MSFSTVKTGQQSTQNATLTNTSNETVTVSKLSISASQFVTAGLKMPLTLAPGQSTNFQVVYYGKTSGSYSGTLSAMTAHGGSSTKVHLRGATATLQGQLSVSVSNLNFGKVLVNGNSTQALTLTNPGSTDIHISQITVSGSGFSVSGVATPYTLSAGQAASLQVAFSPAAAGAATGGITITSDATNSTVTVGLSGTGSSATYTMSLTPGSVSFGNLNVGSTATQSVQVSNTGNSSVTLTQLQASGNGISVSGLAIPLSLAPSQSATFSVSFAPGAAGTIPGSVTVTNNDGISTVAAVTGTGVQAGLSVTPASASFGSVVTGSTNSQTIQLKNNGNANLTISQATVSGSGFSLNGLSLPATLTPGQSTNFNVKYAPQSGGNASGSISIVSNAPNSPATVALSGTGASATYTLALNPGSLSFGSVNDGSTASQSFTVTNTGNSNVSISGVSASGTGFTIAGGGGAVTLSPNQSSTVSVQFAPTTAGNASGSVTVSSNGTSPANVALSGSGVAPSTQHSAALGWSASTSTVAGYNVYRSTVSGGAYVKINSSLVGGVSYSDSSVNSGATYYYVATAVDSSGTESVYSNEVSAVIP